MLLRPYFDLAPGADGMPAHAYGVEYTARSLTGHGLPLPGHVHPGPGFRRRVVTDRARPGYDVDTPTQLPERLRSDRWQVLADRYERFGDLDADSQRGVVNVLDALGLPRALVALRSSVRESEPAGVLAAAVIDRAEHALDRSEPALRRSVDRLERIAWGPGFTVTASLSATLTLVVLFGQGRLGWITSVAPYHQRASDLFASLRPETEWQDLVYTSLYWRAVSYVPFLAGDTATTDRQLDAAERWCRDIPTTTAEQRWVRLMTLHPVLETRAKVARGYGRFSDAVAYAEELVAIDGADGKVHIQLGSLLHAQNPDRALDAYLTATPLGRPYEALAWYRAAQIWRERGEHVAADHALMSSVRADRAAVLPLLALAKSRHAVPGLRTWAMRRLATARGPGSTEAIDAC